MRKRGRNIKAIEKDYVLIRSGVDENERAKHEVSFLINLNKAKCIVDVQYKLERIIRVQLIEKGRTSTIIHIYAPCNDSSKEGNAEIFCMISDMISRVDNKDLYIMRDFNGREEVNLKCRQNPNIKNNMSKHITCMKSKDKR